MVEGSAAKFFTSGHGYYAHRQQKRLGSSVSHTQQIFQIFRLNATSANLLIFPRITDAKFLPKRASNLLIKTV